MKVQLIPEPLKNVWDDWGIELLVTLSCIMQLVLTLFGSCRKTMKSRHVFLRFIIWSAYLLLDSVVTLTIGKLTVIPVSDYTQEITDSELRGLLAPLLLFQLGSRDSITAYSIEDDRLALRKFLNLVFQLCSVLWILLRCWTYTNISYIYFPLLLSGLIKNGEHVWAMFTALKESSGIAISGGKKETCEDIEMVFRNMPRDIPGLELIMKSYYRYLSMMPHTDNWIYRPINKPLHKSLYVDDFKPQDIFKITDVELSLVYDILYTKAPFVYTVSGLVLRLISSLSLISASVVVALFFRDAFTYYINAGFTFGVFGVVITLEIYQIFVLFYSDWTIIEMTKHCGNKPVAKWFLRKLVPRSMKWKRWSNTLAQLNMISYSIHKECLNSRSIGNILKFHGLDMEIRNYFCTTNVRIPEKLKQVIIRGIEDLEEEMKSETTINNGEWKVNRNAMTFGFTRVESLKWTEKDRDFDQRIVIWHLATEIVYGQDMGKSEVGRLLSNYMMYLLATRSHILCTTTSNTAFRQACQALGELLKTNKPDLPNEKAVCSELLAGKFDKQSKAWDVFGDAKKLSEDLLARDDRWKLICSMWVKMLCFAAINSPTDCHAEQLRRGGEIVTHVWLILLHRKQDLVQQEKAV